MLIPADILFNFKFRPSNALLLFLLRLFDALSQLFLFRKTCEIVRNVRLISTHL